MTSNVINCNNNNTKRYVDSRLQTSLVNITVFLAFHKCYQIRKEVVFLLSVSIYFLETKALIRLCGAQADLRLCWSHAKKLGISQQGTYHDL